MCALWKTQSRSELDAGQIEKIFSELRCVKFLKLDGGEVFLREDLSEVTGLLTRLLDPLFLQITTNGSFPERVTSFLEEQASPALYLKVSIDGQREVHDRIRGRQGAYESAVESLAAAARVRSRKRFSLGVNLTFSPENLDPTHLHHVNSLCERYGAKLQCVFAYRQLERGRDAVLPDYGHFAGLEPKVSVVLDELERIQEKTKGKERVRERYFLSGLKNRILRKIIEPNPRCVALRSHVRIDCDGALIVCSNLSRRVSDLRTEPFLQAWRGKLASQARADISSCSGCWIGCETLPNALFTGDILRATFLGSITGNTETSRHKKSELLI
jgi:MoaA/NifB/PqqE/SkfB family radical SAM enzyme